MTPPSSPHLTPHAARATLQRALDTEIVRWNQWMDARGEAKRIARKRYEAARAVRRYAASVVRWIAFIGDGSWKI